VQAACEKADSKATQLAKQVANMESQLTEAQENIREETRQKLAALSRQRQAEDEVANLKEQLEDDEESQKQLENKITSLTTQVCYFVLIGWLLSWFFVSGNLNVCQLFIFLQILLNLSVILQF